MTASVYILTCGALATELNALIRLNHWQHVRIRCLPAELHNRPDEIPGAVREAIELHRHEADHLFVAYADCGTSGKLDAVLEEYGIERLPGAHCYQFLAGHRQFDALADEEPGTFYLTDFLVKHFERLVWDALGLDRHPDLLAEYFGNYRRLVYLSQSTCDALRHRAQDCADRLGLQFRHVPTGLEPLATYVESRVVQWQN